MPIPLAASCDAKPNSSLLSLGTADSIIRSHYRNGFQRAEIMEPGQVYNVRIPLPPISNLFKAGHRIRVDVPSSNVDRFDMNPYTGEPMGRHTHMIMAHNTVYLNSGHPSYAVLPTIPSNSWRYRRDVATRHETE